MLFAANGVTARGKYNGYGKIGRFQIPQEWMHDDIALYTHLVASYEKMIVDHRAFEESMAQAGALLAKYDPEHVPYVPKGTADLEAQLADVRAQLAKAMVENIRFTVYHRRCWEAAGRPGFAGQSRPSEDQGR